MSAEDQNPMRVLLVDHNPLDRAEAKAALLHGSSRTYQFIEASTAREGLRLCSQSPIPDCIVLDLRLPDAGGLEVLSQLPRDADHLLRVPVVVLTGSAAPGLNQAALPRLFTEYQQLDAGYAKQHQGAWLGLALTRRLVEAQHGSVGVRSTPGVGSVFHLVLNRVHGTDEARRAQACVATDAR